MKQFGMKTPVVLKISSAILNEKSERLYYMDILRLLAVMLVMYEHFVMVGSFAMKIPWIINESTPLPLLNADLWQFWRFERFLELFHTQSAILGVLLFFLITGYLIAAMLERYNRVAFIINRIFRIFPALMFCTLIIGGSVYLIQGIKFPLSTYLTTMTLTYQYFRIGAISGVIWTLFIEVWFYSLAFIVGKFDAFRLLAIQIGLLALIYYSTNSTNDPVIIMAGNARFILFILIGSSIKLTEKTEGLFNKVTLLLSSMLFAYLGFQIYVLGHADVSFFANLGSQVGSVSLFLFFYLSDYWLRSFFRKMPFIFYKLADVVYPVYLLHTVIGFNTIYLLRFYIANNYLLLFSAVAVTYLCSAIVHRMVEKPGIRLGQRIKFDFLVSFRIPIIAKLRQIETS